MIILRGGVFFKVFYMFGDVFKWMVEEDFGILEEVFVVVFMELFLEYVE